MKNVLIKSVIGILLVITLFSFINAGGCCFNPSNGKCSLNAEESSCSGGEFFQSPSCSTSKCDLACCILGSNTKFITSRECQILSNNFGFAYPGNWQSMEQSACEQLANSQEKGACLSGGDYEKECKYETQAECGSGDFHAGVFCTESSLNTTCKSTTKTMCYDKNLYGKDSCGNPNGLVQTCDYQAGFICEQKNNTKAYCKDLNCNDIGKKNGDSWCVFGNDPSSGNSIGEQAEVTSVNVGSRYYVERCVNGKVEKEPCADFRMETCVQGEGEAKCENNPWSDCLAANSAEADPTTGSRVDEEACNPEYCYIYDASKSHCVSSGTTGFCTHGDDTSQWYPATINGDTFTITSEANPLTKEQIMSEHGDMTYGGKSDERIQSLHLELCLPKIPGGLNFYSSSESSSSSSKSSSKDSSGGSSDVCSAGNYISTIRFQDQEWDGWYLMNDKEPERYGEWGNVALLMGGISEWSKVAGYNHMYIYGGSTHSSLIPVIVASYSNNIYVYRTTRDPLNNPANVFLPKIWAGSVKGVPIDENIVSALEQRCEAISDCSGKANWVGGAPEAQGFKCKDIQSGGETLCGAPVTSKGIEQPPSGGMGGDDLETVNAQFKFTCKQWKAPEGGDCSLCNEDKSGLPCSEYRCKSIGSCDYYEPDGVDNGYCMSSSDNSAPVIESATLNPNSPIPPYTPVEITVTTDEVSECKFDLNKAGAKYDDMDYDFGDGFRKEHKVTLTLPGQTAGLDENTTEYELITKDGKYTLYVRCIDPANNGQTKPAYPVNFEVMTYPDTNPPSLSNFNPLSGSRIKFNTTEKIISFNLNEPAQCKWDLQETYNMDLMKNSFSCTESININPVDKYTCTGKLTNVTTAYENETTFYIRCKDQPWITNGSIIENRVNYSRNEMKNSYVYKLKASEKFYISDISPSGSVEVSSNDYNITLRVMTQGGAFSGKANCSWRTANNTEDLMNQSFQRFKTTDASISSQVITSPVIGDNLFEIRCNDESGNEDRMNVTLSVSIDDGSPFINRLYQLSGKLKLKTDEDSLCYYSFDSILNCLFDTNNATLMSGLYSKDHETDWNDDKNYYVKCKDIFGNYDTGCGKIIRTY